MTIVLKLSISKISSILYFLFLTQLNHNIKFLRKKCKYYRYNIIHNNFLTFIVIFILFIYYKISDYYTSNLTIHYDTFWNTKCCKSICYTQYYCPFSYFIYNCISNFFLLSCYHNF